MPPRLLNNTDHHAELAIPDKAKRRLVGDLRVRTPPKAHLKRHMYLSMQAPQ